MNIDKKTEFYRNFGRNIYYVENHEDTIRNIAPESIAFISVAEAGAMGIPNGVVIAAENEHKVTWYMFNLAEDSFEDLKSVWPSFDTFSPWEEDHGLAEGWRYMDLGAGNHLMMRDRYAKKFHRELRKLKPEHAGIIYMTWKAIAHTILTEGTDENMYLRNIENAAGNVLRYMERSDHDIFIRNFIDAVRIAMEMKETVIVPVEPSQEAFEVFDPEKVQAGDVIELEQPLRLKILDITLADGSRAYTAFTSYEELEKGESVSSVQADLRGYLRDALGNPEITAVVLNPWGQPFVIPEEIIRLILEDFQ